jgi:2-polyprenyl-3-methyl-5-hydroxy-6-metoxy-1,4-benzoquinol methylase
MSSSEKFWDRSANTYDQEEDKDEQTYLLNLEKTKQRLKSSDLVLDFGCGTGRMSNELAGSVQRIHANDISAKMIEIARQKAAARNLANIDYAQATLFDDRYQSGAYDAILAFYILHLLDDPHHAMQRMNDLLKPGGLLISTTPCIGEKTSLRIPLLLLGKVGVVPKLSALKASDLTALIAAGNFEMLETACLQKSTAQYFIVARKNL